MKSRDFEIAFVGLSADRHCFEYDIKDTFFENFAQPDFSEASIKVKLTLDKKPGVLLLHFEVHGTAQSICDRCGDDLTMTLWDEFDHLVEMVDDDLVDSMSEEDAEVTYISKGDSVLDVGGLIYEFIIFSQPIQKVHEDLEDGSSGCNEEVMNVLNEKKEHTSNTMWEDLKKKIKTK